MKVLGQRTDLILCRQLVFQRNELMKVFRLDDVLRFHNNTSTAQQYILQSHRFSFPICPICNETLLAKTVYHWFTELMIHYEYGNLSLSDEFGKIFRKTTKLRKT